jgi:CubicO group peptidase (beta-lactamase class C family)
MNRVEKHFLAKLGDAWKDATPGLCVQAYARGRKILDLEIGKTYPVYDWASLTKIAFTVSRLMVLHEEGRFRVNDPVAKWVSWYPREHRARLRDLLSHSAGLTWWYPFYKDVVKKTKPRQSPEEAWKIFEQILKKRVLKDLKGKRFSSKTKSVYSDLDFFLLGLSLEAISGETMYDNWHEHRELLGLAKTDFHRDNKPPRMHPRAKCAPTEVDEVWRHKTLQGEVHDQNTWSIKGVAPHAGLFGPIDDLSSFGLSLRKAMFGEAGAFVGETTARLFTRRAIARRQGDWSLGFTLPTKGATSCGPLFSLDSVGHLGFTGTSLWFDPKRDLLVTILSNRVYPTVENKKFVSLRAPMHTWIAEESRVR